MAQRRAEVFGPTFDAVRLVFSRGLHSSTSSLLAVAVCIPHAGMRASVCEHFTSSNSCVTAAFASTIAAVPAVYSTPFDAAAAQPLPPPWPGDFHCPPHRSTVDSVQAINVAVARTAVAVSGSSVGEGDRSPSPSSSPPSPLPLPLPKPALLLASSLVHRVVCCVLAAATTQLRHRSSLGTVTVGASIDVLRRVEPRRVELRRVVLCRRA